MNKTTEGFNQACAASYDEQRQKIAPMKDILHLLMRMILSDLPSDAKILCVGVGTGAELIELAKTNPQWTFTAVEPAAPMLKKCKQLCEAENILSRCTFHEGYLDSLPQTQPFNAATSILVSHFLMQTDERRKYFRQIASRLRPKGYLINADLASDMSSSNYQHLLNVWKKTMRLANMPEKNIDNLGVKLAVIPATEIENIIESSGFSTPVLFYQALLMHAWYAQVS